MPTAGLVRVFALARYRGVGRRLLIAYKERGRRDLAPSLGWALAEALAVLPLKGAGSAGIGGVAGTASAGGFAVCGVGTASVGQSPDPVWSTGTVSGCQPARSAEPPSDRVPDESESGGSAECHRSMSPGTASADRLLGQVGSAGFAEVRWPPNPALSDATASADLLSDRSRSTGSVPSPRKLCLVPAPSRPSASRLRGGPHVERLAEAAARVLATRGFEVAVAPALELAGSARDAVGLGHAQRAANLAGRLRFRHAGRPPPGFPVVVLDDVVTTGATAAACTHALAAEGITVSAVLTLLAAG
jgi:predicted amidophosphoribosyltransferase